MWAPLHAVWAPPVLCGTARRVPPTASTAAGSELTQQPLGSSGLTREFSAGLAPQELKEWANQFGTSGSKQGLQSRRLSYFT